MKLPTARVSGRQSRIIAIAVTLAALLMPLAQSNLALAQSKPRSSGVTNPSNPTTCPFNFLDVRSTDYFYDGVRYLFCMGAISGYLDDTFRPGNTTTRAQLSKIVVIART